MEFYNLKNVPPRLVQAMKTKGVKKTRMKPVQSRFNSGLREILVWFRFINRMKIVTRHSAVVAATIISLSFSSLRLGAHCNGVFDAQKP